jgi:hypothetical protein
MSLAVNTIQFFMDDQSPYVNKSSFLLRDLLIGPHALSQFFISRSDNMFY